MTEQELKDDVRQQTGYVRPFVLSEDALDTAYRNAKRHIRVKTGLPNSAEWFTDDPAREDALYWWTCLFAKMAVGELDSQDLQVGAIDQKSLLAKDDDQITQWFLNARSSVNSISVEDGASTVLQAVSVTRDNRTYGEDDSSTGDSLGGSGDISL